MNLKKAFYPNEEVEKILRSVPKGKISERLNELILKGLSYEKQEQIALAYMKHDAELASSPPRVRHQSGLSTTMMMSQKAFEAEDEVEDFI